MNERLLRGLLRRGPPRRPCRGPRRPRHRRRPGPAGGPRRAPARAPTPTTSRPTSARGGRTASRACRSSSSTSGTASRERKTRPVRAATGAMADDSTGSRHDNRRSRPRPSDAGRRKRAGMRERSRPVPWRGRRARPDGWPVWVRGTQPPPEGPVAAAPSCRPTFHSWSAFHLRGCIATWGAARRREPPAHRWLQAVRRSRLRSHKRAFQPLSSVRVQVGQLDPGRASR